MKRANHLPPTKIGVLLLQKEEKVNILETFTFPSFKRRGVITEGNDGVVKV
jgi:hypothetical protein